jgi:hypothetical protein
MRSIHTPGILRQVLQDGDMTRADDHQNTIGAGRPNSLNVAENPEITVVPSGLRIGALVVGRDGLVSKWSDCRCEVYTYPDCRDGLFVADVVRLGKGHTEGLEPKVTEELVKLMASAKGGKIQQAR